MTGLPISKIETDYDVTGGKFETVQLTLLTGLTISKIETDYDVTGGELKTVQHTVDCCCSIGDQYQISGVTL